MEKLNDWTEAPKVVFGIDIGTSHSAISFAYLQTNKEPSIENVSTWPGQSDKPARAKTVTAIYYDKNNTPRSYGALTQTNEIKEQARKEGWLLVDSFKRYIHDLGNVVSTDASLQTDVHKLILPAGVPIEAVYTHWIKYLFSHAESVFVEKYTKLVWDRLRQGIEVVFTVPNGWYAQEHGILARAALKANVVQKFAQVSFVPETEAAIHWALLAEDLSLRAHTNFLVCDAGGSTTDIALYTVNGNSPLQLQERKDFPSKCIEAGSALITDTFLEDLVGQMFAPGDDPGDFADAVREGVTKEKHGFDAAKDTIEIPVAGDVKENFPDGKVEVPSENLALHFDREIAKIVAAIDELKANNNPELLLLLGDFGRNVYFQDQLKDKYEPGMDVVYVGEKHIKAAAPGSLIWFLQGIVVARAARFAFGMHVLVPYDSNNPEHKGRTVINNPDGKFVQHGWNQIVAFGTLLTDGQEHNRPYYRAYQEPNARLADFETELYTADEDATNSKWIADADGNLLPGFHRRCTVRADISKLQGKLPTRVSAGGSTYWYLDFKIAVKFGATSPEARIVWTEDGKVVSGEANVIPAKLT